MRQKRQLRPGPRSESAELDRLVEVHGARTESCEAVDEDTDYWTDSSLFQMDHILSSEICRMKCIREKDCGAWTWGKARGVPGLTNVCFLKVLADGREPVKHSKPGVISGLRPGRACAVSDDDISAFTGVKSGRIRNHRGMCLEAAQPNTNQARVHVMKCKAGETGQQWSYHSATGQIKDQFGICVGCLGKNQEYSGVTMEVCNTSSPAQQWSWNKKTGQIVNWHGICMGAPGQSAVYMEKCDMSNFDQQWEIGVDQDRLYYDDRRYGGPNGPDAKVGTAFCFALMLPDSYEQKLLAMQHEERASLFACDEAAVFSNREVEIAEGLWTSAVQSDLKCEKGGEFNTALNLPIFLAVWTKVIGSGQFLRHDWTVKVDPDTVFMPERLPHILQVHPESEKGVYLNNCKFGLHGPLEIFSRNAVKAWAMGSERCVEYFTRLCNGDCKWGEDMFVDQCLHRVLELRRDNDFRLLVEDHCDPPPGWMSCEDTNYAAYHPFKQIESYRQCLRHAKNSR
jgi:hypothetical protein